MTGAVVHDFTHPLPASGPPLPRSQLHLDRTVSVLFRADCSVQLGGEPGDLLGELGVLREQCQVLFSEILFASQYFGLAGLEGALAPNIGVVVQR